MIAADSLVDPGLSCWCSYVSVVLAVGHLSERSTVRDPALAQARSG